MYKYKNYQVNLLWNRYSNNDRVSLALVDASDGIAVCMVSMNVPEVPLEPDQIVVKTYGGNDQIEQFLKENGIASHTNHWVPTSFGQSQPIYKLLIPAENG